MTKNEFEAKRQEAMENMRKMNSRSKSKPQTQPVEKPKNPTEPTPVNKPPNTAVGANVNLPFINSKFDPDTALIMGLIFLLSKENCDKKLLLALMYILF